MKTSSELLETSDPGIANTLRNMQSEVKRSWEEITSKTEDEGKKLDFALQKATKLNDGSVEMVTWITEIKEELVIFEVISVVFEKVEEQKNKYKVWLHSLYWYHTTPIPAFLYPRYNYHHKPQCTLHS